jgi:HEAT repeat protein
MVRSHAAWALGEIDSPAAREHLVRARATEHDPAVVEEIETALGCYELRADARGVGRRPTLK